MTNERAPLPNAHAVFDTVEALLSPATLSHLIGQPVREVQRGPFSSVDGRSGGHLETVEAGRAGRYVLKHISWECDLTMRLTADHSGRAVVIWQKGLLDRLPPQIAYGVVGCARDGDGWVILLEDFRGYMLPPHEQRLTEEDNGMVLDAMAALHERFWDEPSTTARRYGLCSLRTRYQGIFPGAMLGEKDTQLPLVPYIHEGWQLLLELVDPDIAHLVQRLHGDVGPLCRALERYPHTLLHGDWHHGNVGIIPGLEPQVILLDWTFVTLGPPAADLAEYVLIGVMRLPSSKEATIERYRHLLALRLGKQFDDSWWVPQLELALLGEFLRLGFDKAQTAVHGPSEAIRERERQEIAWWCEKSRRATQWL